MQASLPLIERTWTAGHVLNQRLIAPRMVPVAHKKRKVSPTTTSSSSTLCVSIVDMPSLSSTDPVAVELRNFGLYRIHFVQRLARINDDNQDFVTIVSCRARLTERVGNDLMHRSTHLTSVAMLMIESLKSALTLLERRMHSTEELCQRSFVPSALNLCFKPVVDMTSTEKQGYFLSGVMRDIPQRHQVVSASRKMTETLYAKLLHLINTDGWKSEETYRAFLDYFISWKYLINSSRLLLQLLATCLEIVGSRLNLIQIENVENI